VYYPVFLISTDRKVRERATDFPNVASASHASLCVLCERIPERFCLAVDLLHNHNEVDESTKQALERTSLSLSLYVRVCVPVAELMICLATQQQQHSNNNNTHTKKKKKKKQCGYKDVFVSSVVVVVCVIAVVYITLLCMRVFEWELLQN
jgi:hypothetical protein